MKYKINKKRVSIKNMDDKNFKDDSFLGGSYLRMKFSTNDSYSNDKVFHDNRIVGVDVEVKLKSGFLSWDDIIDEIADFKNKYCLDAGGLDYFDIIEEGYFTYIEPVFYNRY